MKKSRFGAILSAASLLFCCLTFKAEAAVSIQLSPSSQTIGVGEVTTVEVSVLRDSMDPSSAIGAFLQEIFITGTAAQFNGFTFGNSLDLGMLGSLPSVVEETYEFIPDTTFLSIAEVSLESSADLVMSQQDFVVLGTLTFTGAHAGIVSIFPSTSDFSTPDGERSVLTGEPFEALITVLQIPTVPEAKTLAYVTLSLALVLGWKERNRRRLNRTEF